MSFVCVYIFLCQLQLRLSVAVLMSSISYWPSEGVIAGIDCTKIHSNKELFWCTLSIFIQYRKNCSVFFVWKDTKSAKNMQDPYFVWFYTNGLCFFLRCIVFCTVWNELNRKEGAVLTIILSWVFTTYLFNRDSSSQLSKQSINFTKTRNFCLIEYDSQMICLHSTENRFI